jgi:hypothetical protein
MSATRKPKTKIPLCCPKKKRKKKYEIFYLAAPAAGAVLGDLSTKGTKFAEERNQILVRHIKRQVTHEEPSARPSEESWMGLLRTEPERRNEGEKRVREGTNKEMIIDIMDRVREYSRLQFKGRRERGRGDRDAHARLERLIGLSVPFKKKMVGE